MGYRGEFFWLKVKIASHNKEIECNKGDNLLDVIRDNKIFIDAPCNGSMVCGKCKVKLINGNVDSEMNVHISNEERNQGYILSCASKIIEDIEIEIPSKLSSSINEMKIEGSDKNNDKKLFERSINMLKENGLEFTN